MTVDDIARLLEDRLGDIDRAIVLAHVRTCKQCHELYQDSAVELGLHESGMAEPMDTPDGLVADGLRVVGEVQTGREADASRHGRIWRNWKTRAVTVAAVFLVIAVGAWFSVRIAGQLTRSGLDPDVLGPIKVAVAEYSMTDVFVLPGGEAFIGGSSPVYRSVRGSRSNSDYERVDISLDTLYDRYESGGETPDVAYWLVAGYLSTHRLGSARVYIADARKLFPEDARLMVLDAIVAYMDGAIGRSEGLLRTAQAAHPRDPAILIDLAIVLGEQQKSTEARELLEKVRELNKNTAIAGRAEAILSKMD